MTLIARRPFIACLAVCAAALFAPGALSAQDQPAITVFAAASLTDALQAVGKAFTARAGVPVRFSFGSSSVGAKQIAGGAKADLFVSADAEWMDFAVDKGAVDKTSRVNLVRGRLALIAPADSKVALRIAPGFALLNTLGDGGRLAMGDPDYVPAGRYGRAALTRLGVWQGIAPRIARADNVRAALAYVSRHEAPLGIVYETDARIDPGVRIVGIFPEATHDPIVYPAALTSGTSPAGRSFYKFLRSGQAQAIFKRYGFLRP